LGLCYREAIEKKGSFGDSKEMGRTLWQGQRKDRWGRRLGVQLVWPVNHEEADRLGKNKDLSRQHLCVYEQIPQGME